MITLTNEITKIFADKYKKIFRHPYRKQDTRKLQMRRKPDVYAYKKHITEEHYTSPYNKNIATRSKQVHFGHVQQDLLRGKFTKQLEIRHYNTSTKGRKRPKGC